MAVVVLDRVSKRYAGSGDFAVHDVSFTVGEGEFMVLLGPSGCGKSTVLRMIAGLEPITDGTVAIDRRTMNAVPAKDRDIAMVFQSYALYPHMTVFDNLAFGLRRRGFERAAISARVNGVAEKLGLSEVVSRKPFALSGGQRQRVALGRAIVRNPKVFLFDEPLSNLDAALRVSTRNELIKQQHELGTTTIYVTHDQVEAMTMGHRICIMNKGEVVQIGRPLEVYRRPVDTFVARFLGNPPMNLLATRVEAIAGEYSMVVGSQRIKLVADLSASLRGRNWDSVTLGIRPEDFYEVAPAGIGESPSRLAVRVVAVEPLGAETLVVCELDGVSEDIIARVGRDTALATGDRVELYVDPGAVHLFDPATSQAICAGTG
jgi:multiple sugar transport system ATP-binding protein